MTGTPIRSRLASIACGDAQPRVTRFPRLNDAPNALGLVSAASTDGTSTSVATIARTETKTFRIMLSSSSRRAFLSLTGWWSHASPIRVSGLRHRGGAPEAQSDGAARSVDHPGLNYRAERAKLEAQAVN